ncbi:hypothetical protein KUTeg_014147 [Tegillarca granosa]|uniref:Uncharacterized protein n=1 Tax=Tegillarca granosa TaxID=220873 RepID=A0ABQ9EVT3_TEGGR|nr:hypothetical protein KUTeg_014147 [Tegillarca granosa]
MVGKDFFYNFHNIGLARQNETTIRRLKVGFRLMKAYGEVIQIEMTGFGDLCNVIIRGRISAMFSSIVFFPDGVQKNTLPITK